MRRTVRSRVRDLAVGALAVPPAARGRSGRAAPAVALGLLVTGCVDPEARFDEFLARARIDSGSDAAGSDAAGGAAGQGAGCRLPEPEELDGSFLLVISVQAAPAKPVVYLLQSSNREHGDGLQVSTTSRPLSKYDRHTVVGGESSVVAASYPVAADGSFTAVMPPAVTPAEAEPVTNSEVVSQITLTGRVCSVRDPDRPDALIDFTCGEVALHLSSPATLDMAGTFASLRITDPDLYPDALIDCDRHPADPPPPRP